ncbi:MAG: hypothetical protein ACOY4O_16635 [Pseudomonadota bacterium]|jgi:hypothetical protein
MSDYCQPEMPSYITSHVTLESMSFAPCADPAAVITIARTAARPLTWRKGARNIHAAASN